MFNSEENMKKIACRLKEAREKAGISLQELANRTGMSKSTLQRYEAGGIKNVPLDKLEVLSKGLGCTSQYLIGWDNITPVASPTAKTVKIPVLGAVPAGTPVEAVQDIIDYEDIPLDWTKKGDFFGLQIKGDSMETDIHDSDIVIVRKQSDADSGDVVIAMVNSDEATCKRLKKLDDGIMLVPNNKNYEPMYYSRKAVKSKPVVIIGKVVELRRKL